MRQENKPVLIVDCLTGSVEAELVPTGKNQWRLDVTAGGEGFAGRFSVKTSIAVLSPWFMLPGIFHGLGRQDRTKVYPELCARPDPDDMWQQSEWAFALDRMALPLAGVHDGGRWHVWESDTHYEMTDGVLSGAQDKELQVGFGLAWDGRQATLSVNIPAVEGPVRHVRSPLTHAVKPTVELQPGGRLSVSLRWHELDGERFDFAKIQRGAELRLRDSNPPAVLAVEPLEYAEIAYDGLKDWHWQPAAEDGRPGYFIYTAAMDRSVEFNANHNRGTTLCWHFDATGFVGGFPVAYGLLSHAVRSGRSLDDPWVRDVLGYTNRLATEAPAASGLIRTSYHPGKGRNLNGEYDNGPEEPAYGSCWTEPGTAHARTTADAVWHLARIVNLLDGKCHAVGAWKRTCLEAVKAALRAQGKDGRHPQLYDVESGVALAAGGDGGLLWIPAMLETASFCEDKHLAEQLLLSVRRAGAAYESCVRNWWICGAPEDVGNSPTSEDAGNAVLAYSRLYQLDGPRWLDTWKIAADYLLTWRKAYNVRFGPANMLTQAGFRTNGGDFASNHNNHLHGYEVNATSDMQLLSEVTGDVHYALRAKDHLCFLLQMLCREAGHWNGQRGMLTEQFYCVDWSVWGTWNPGPAHVQKGTLMGFSHSWCVNMVLLGIDEWLGSRNQRMLARRGKGHDPSFDSSCAPVQKAARK